MPPPPISPLPKFWSVFIPVSERIHDTERLVFGTGGEGSGNPSEFVVELIVREGVGRKRGVERVLEGWSSVLNGPCELTALESTKKYAENPKEVRTQLADSAEETLTCHFLAYASCGSRSYTKLIFQSEPDSLAARVSSTGPTTLCSRG